MNFCVAIFNKYFLWRKSGLLLCLLCCQLFAFGQACDADFTFTQSCNIVTFTASGTSDLNYLWDFGDGTTSTEQNPVHIYVVDDPGPQNYSVTLTVSGTTCVENSTTQTIFMTVGELSNPVLESILIPPFTNCSATNDNPNHTLFLIHATTPMDNANYHIDWGDGTAPYTDDEYFETVTHEYTQIGVFDIVFTVIGNNGCAAQVTYEFFNGNSPGVGLSTPSNTVACVPSIVQFPYNEEVLDNPAGTTYTLFVDDGGGDTTVIEHPPITPYYEHEFFNSPCDSNLTEYTVTMIAKNSCNSQTSTSSIKLDRAPEGDFEINPNPVCVNEEVEVTNTSEPGVYTANGECREDMSSFWSISPGVEGVDYIVDGNLGNFPAPLGDSAGFVVTFLTHGSYQITLSYGSLGFSACPRDTVIKTVCVLPEPIASVDDNLAGDGCFPDQVNLINTSNTVDNCSAAEYFWDVTLLDSDCEGEGDWTFVNNTSDTTQNASILFESSGEFEVTLIVENICGVDTARTTIEIGESPISMITPIDTFCNSASIFPEVSSLSSCAGDVPTYSWSFPTGNPTTATGSSPGPIVFNTPGPHVINLITENACGTDTTQEIIHIYEDPEAPGIDSNSPVCMGEDITLLLVEDPGGVSYEWTGPGSFTSSLANPVIPNAMSSDAGTYTLTVTDTISGCTNQASLEVIVIMAESVDITPDDPEICIGSSVTLTASGAISYTWSPGDYLNTTTGPEVIVTPPGDLDPLPFTIQYTVNGANNSNECSATDTVTVTIHPLPIVSAGVPQSACVGVPLQLTGDPLDGDGGEGIWTGLFVSTDGVFNAAMPGNYTLTYTFTDDNFCQEGSTVEICVLNAPQANFSVSETMGCEGLIVDTENLSGYTEDGCAGVSYLWDATFINAECHDNPGDWSFSTGTATDENPSFQFSESGIYEISLTVYSPCDTTVFTNSIEVGESPQVDLLEINDFCDMSSFVPVIDTLLNCNSPVTYFWEFPGVDGPQTSTDPTPPVLSYSSTGDYTLILTITNVCGSDSDTITFSILEDLVADFEVIDFACLDPDFSLVPVNNSIGDQPEYTWMINGPGSPSIDDPNLPAPTLTVTAPGEYIITLTASNEVCGPSVHEDTLQINTTPGVTLEPITDICVGGTITPSVTYSPSLDFIDTIYWEFPGGLSLSGNPNSPGEIEYTTSGNYIVTVFVENACGIDSSSQSFQVLEGPVAIGVLDTTFACIPPEFTFSPNNLSTGDNLSYNWSVTSPGVLMNPDNAEPDITLPNTGWYTIQLETGNGVCPPSIWTDSIFVSTAPEFTLEDIGNGCVGSPIQPTVTYSNTALIDSVRWVFPGATPATSTSFDPPELTYGGSTGTFTAYLTAYNACATTIDSVSFDLLEELNAEAVLDTTFACIPGPFTLEVTNMTTGGNPIYMWSISSPGTISNANDEAPTFTLPATGWYEINLEATNGVCPASTWTDSIFISTLPDFTLNPIDDACAGSPIIPSVEYDDVSLIDSVFWEFPGAIPEISTDLMPPALDYGAAIDVFTIYLTTYNRCGTILDSVSFELLEALNADAQLDTSFACIPPDFNLGVNNLSTGGNPIFEWEVTEPATVSNPNNISPDFNFPDTGWYTITLTVTNNGICPESNWQDSILISTAPSVELLSINDFCESVELFPLVNYSDTTRIDSVIWSFPGGSPVISNNFFPGPISYSGAGDYTFEVTVFNACGSQSDQLTFTIDTIPEITLSPQDTICKLEGIYTIPEPNPPGGTWSGSDAIVGQNPGLFDPTILPPGDTTVTIFYNFEVGECMVSTPKEIVVFDLSIVMTEPEILDVCVSEDTIILNNGNPGGGWYVGTGVTDTLAGIFEPSQIGIGTYSIIYYFQLPFTDCIGTDTFTVIVHPLPVPIIQGVDSLCVNVPETIFNGTAGMNTYEWNIEDTTYFINNPTHVFQDTGTVDIQLIVTSQFGCVDSITTEVYISGPPIADFFMDTTQGCAVLPVAFTNNSIGFQHVNYSWDFGNQITSTLENPDTIFFEDGTVDTTYYITLTAENHCGLDMVIDSVLVFPRPQPYFLPSQFSGCTPVYVAFDNFTVGLPDSVWWDFGNGMGSSDFIPPDQEYIAEDTVNVIYTVTLYAFNECGIDSFSQDILVKPEEVRAFFNVNVNEGCEPLEVQFNSSSSPDSTIIYNWYFGDFLTSNSEDTTVNFSTTGDTSTIYPVLLVVDNGCDVDSFGLDIIVYPQPIVDFVALEESCVGDSIIFTNTSIDVNGILWDFGDGATSTLTDPIHVYDSPGPYTITMTAFSANNGCPNTISRDILILPVPVAAFTLDTLSGCPPLSVSWTNQSTGGNFYIWDFGDGNSNVGQNPPPHTYQGSGIFDVTLTVTDNAGCSHDTVFSAIEVFPVPIAQFSALLSQECGVPQEVCFENNSQGASGFVWNLGNGEQSMENEPCTDYQNAGDYIIELVAENQYLCSDAYTDTLILYEEPIANFTPSDTSLCQFTEFTFDNLSLNASVFEWLIDGEIVDTGSSFTYFFSDTGQYVIELIAGNDSGCTDSLLGQSIRINPSPTADFIYDKMPNALPTTFQFTDRSSPDAISFWWDFDDGTILEEKDPRHRFLSSFDKNVVHWVGNRYDCWDTTLQVIDLDTLFGLYVPNIMEPNLIGNPEKQFFIPKGIGLAEYHIAIYARNGQLLWESTKLDNDADPMEGIPQEYWDGTFRGQDMPSGTYVWRVIEARFFNGTTWQGMRDEDGRLWKSNYFYLVR